MPKIYFQVASLDKWGRHRTEGYTYIDIPSFPGLELFFVFFGNIILLNRIL
jgi:hypothetical protein